MPTTTPKENRRHRYYCENCDAKWIDIAPYCSNCESSKYVTIDEPVIRVPKKSATPPETKDWQKVKGGGYVDMNAPQWKKKTSSETKDMVRGWESSFDEEFVERNIWDATLPLLYNTPFDDINKIKDFISSLLEKQRQETKEKIISLFPDWLDDVEETTDKPPTDPTVAADQTARHFRDKVLQALTKE